MATADEAADAKTQLGADLAAGVNTLSLSQEVTFTKYVKLVLPIDGFVFWVRADLASAKALYNAARYNGFAYNEGIEITPIPTVTVQGSLHFSTVTDQQETQTIAVNSVVFTALKPIEDFNQIGPAVLYLAEFDPGGGEVPIRFSFTQRAPFYKQAGLYHYRGNAVYPAMRPQIVDSPAQLNTRQVVSNSLPLWLALNNFSFSYGYGLFSTVPLYPSFAVPDNISPPYVSVHIEPSSTRPLQAAPLLDLSLSHTQLMREVALLTLYGLRNDDALTFIDVVNQYTLDSDSLGIMNMPGIRDEKYTQSEMATLAMKKTVEYEVNYFQTVARDVSRKLIRSAIPTYVIEPAAAAA